MFRLICIIFGYFTGCIQTAYYVGKLSGNIDIREHGSGNAGTTNITRTLGAKAGLITFLTDIFKAALVYIICSFVFKGAGSFYTYHGLGGNGLLPGLYGGLGVVLGHNFPVQLKFKGGKGVAATLSLFLCVNLSLALTTYGIGIIILFASSYISLASLLTTLIYTARASFSGFSAEEKALIAVLTVLVFIKHRENIKRLATGTERKFSVKKRDKE